MGSNERVRKKNRQADTMQNSEDDKSIMWIDPGDEGDKKTKPKNTAPSFEIFNPKLILSQSVFHSRITKGKRDANQQEK
jgi:hypothetical protein